MTDPTPEQKGDARREQAGRGYPIGSEDEAWSSEYAGQVASDIPLSHVAISAYDWPMSGDALALTKAGVIA
jgi:hypothetical protein